MKFPILSSFVSTVSFIFSRIVLGSALMASHFAFSDAPGQFFFGLFCKGFFALVGFPGWVGSIGSSAEEPINWKYWSMLDPCSYSIKHLFFPWFIFRSFASDIFLKPQGHSWAFLSESVVWASWIVLVFLFVISIRRSLAVWTVSELSSVPTLADCLGIFCWAAFIAISDCLWIPIPIGSSLTHAAGRSSAQFRLQATLQDVKKS